MLLLGMILVIVLLFLPISEHLDGAPYETCGVRDSHGTCFKDEQARARAVQRGLQKKCGKKPDPSGCEGGQFKCIKGGKNGDVPAAWTCLDFTYVTRRAVNKDGSEKGWKKDVPYRCNQGTVDTTRDWGTDGEKNQCQHIRFTEDECKAKGDGWVWHGTSKRCTYDKGHCDAGSNAAYENHSIWKDGRCQRRT